MGVARAAGMRLQRFLAEAGIGSRRACEDLIEQKRVLVNGHVAELGTTVDEARDRVTVDGEGVRPNRVRLYLMMNKPRGTLVTMADPKGRPNVYKMLPALPARVHAVGRLDFQSEGLLLFTNDGDLTRALTHPSGRVERVYDVKIQGDVPDWAIPRLMKGVKLDDGFARVARCERLRLARTNCWLQVTLTEGRYREVRRLFSAIGMNVLKLKRVRFGPIKLGTMKIGDIRALRPEEIESLRASAEGRGPLRDSARPATDAPARPARTSAGRHSSPPRRGNARAGSEVVASVPGRATTRERPARVTARERPARGRPAR